MKKFLLIFVLIFVTGCSISYDVKIDNLSLIEDTSIVADYSYKDYSIGGINILEFKNYYVRDYIPYHYDDLYSPESHVKFDGVSYYEISDLSDGSKIGANLKGKFDFDGYSKSNLVWKGCRKKNIKFEGDVFSVSASEFKVFDDYKLLDDLTVNIKSSYKVIDNNADKVVNNTYIWKIDRNNYKNKAIDISFKTSSILDDIAIGVKNDSIYVFGLLLFVIILLLVIIYYFVMKKYNQNNSL